MGLVINISKNAIAQITPDNTLGAESSTINHGALKDIINGGATRGTNLFHSFQEFNVDAGKSVYFANPTGIENILTRVTGGNVSNILGTLGVEGTANLFLINPNGIFFGNGASLDIRGSFTATTADSIKLGENGLFSATAPATSHLLNIQPEALFRNALRNQQAEIKSEGNLTVGQNLTFNADNLNLSGQIQAGGNLNLKANHTISIDGGNINTDNYGTGQGGDINITTGSLYLTNASILSASTYGQGDAGTMKITATDSVKFDGRSYAESQVQKGAVGKAGGVDISTKSIELLGGSFLPASTFGQGDAGTVKITATDSVKFDGRSYAESRVGTGAVGKAGGVDISTKSLELLGGSDIDASTFGQGDAGTVKITATDAVKFDGGSSAGSQVRAGAVGKAGGVDISTKSLELLGGSLLTASTFGQGDAGTVKITATDSVKFDGRSYATSQVGTGAVGKAGGVDISTKSLELLGGSFLAASTFGQGDAGTVKITATDAVKFDGRSSAGSQVRAGAVGKAGGVDISTKSLELLGGSFLTASTFGQGDAGTVKITATDSVKFDGNSSAGSQVQTGAVGKAGGVDISTKSLELLGGSLLTASTFGQGDAGTVKITATDSVKFDDRSYAESRVEEGAVGNAGGVGISTKTLELLGGSFLDASTLGQGDAGTVKITATDSVKFDDGSYAESRVEEGAVGNAGGVGISTKSLELLGGSDIDASTFGQGDAGTVKITATDSVKFDDGSYAESRVEEGAVGNAGGVGISTKSLELLGGSDIDASTFGQGDAGTVKITATDSVKFDGGSYAESQVGTGAVGKAGGVDISTKSLELLGGSLLTASTFGQGDAGTVKITATDSVKFDGRSSAGSQVGTGAVGKAGGVDISTKSLELLGGSLLTASTFGQGDAGTVKITATDSVKFDGRSYATSQVGTGAVGKAGGVDISTKTLELLGGSFLAASTFGQGDAGTVKITATDAVKFDGGSSAGSQVRAGAVGKAGGVDISTKSLELLGGSFLTASTFGQGDAGTVKITATDSVKFDGNSSAGSQVAAGAVGKAGGVGISTKSLELLGGSFLDASTFGQGDAGTVKITATDAVKFDGNSSAGSQVQTGAVGKAGGVDISTKSLELLGGSELRANTFGQGDAGTVKITANTLNITNNSTIKTNTSSSGNAGDILVNTSTLNLTNGGNIFAFTNGSGNGGTVTINALNSVNIGEGVQNFAPIISVETNNTGKAGDIIINSPNFTLSETARITATTTETATNQDYGGSITLNASKINLAGVVGVFAETQGQAPAGTLKLNPYQNQPDLDITMFPNSILSASTSASGKGGDLQITAPENINISGQGKLAVESKGSGDAGNILITSQNLNLSDGVKISASTSGSGKGGNIIVKVKDKITLDGTNTGLFASTEKGSTGDSGSIDIDPQLFIIKNGAGIGVNSQGSGKGGDISVQAGTLTLDNKAFINAATASSQGGGITLQIKDLLFMRHHSNITATAGTDQSGGNGGNININSPFIVAVPYENNDITANAYLGKGGNINITTNQLFGLQYRPQETALSDITASSEFGVSGNVEITTPGVDPTSGLTNLPTSLVDAESLNKDVCAIKDDKIAGGSSFIITGKGGLPADTHELISNSPAFVEWENISPNLTQVSTSPVKVTQKNINHHPQIQQAQGWMVTPDGKVVLTADPEKVTLQADKNNLPDCK
ncbi:MAG: filamentous hemagglutinin N-terminal domain-containing protein [Dolichospermum sp. DET50]|nr:filamentous hemagglutinin N-terminal domain-containing protein [Dolichospermum sp. DET66]MBS3033839.1 filamentous hemagglutinin N-terminal domain-containing protein [Dolichospermum sp. DET67]MBS3039042.1 filamentous hemagglutinin N-terminal domain-containing protein [Dolichospermum sp. DET50]QSX70694.1 MAG: filamentous hemagglutinin N-terminal domain-containing protein [Dolichospermum sp. DET69]